MSYLLTGDFRLSPDHPPLSRMWCALPLLLTDQRWPPADAPAWEVGHYWLLGRQWLFEENDGERLVQIARCMMVVLYVLTCLVIYRLARTILGPGPGLLSLILAVFSTTMLAHGRYVTTDMPVTLMFLLALAAIARLFSGITIPRVLLAGLALGGLSITKFSWPLVLPAAAIMALYVILRRSPLQVAGRLARSSRNSAKSAYVDGSPATGHHAACIEVHDRLFRTIILAGVGIALLLITWATIWTCFCWRYASVPPESRTFELSLIQTGIWDTMLYQASAGRSSATVWFLEFANEYRLLPESYLHGLAYTLGSTQERPAYLMGAYSNAGWRSYFPIAFAIKTEIPLLILLVMGIVAFALRRIRPRDPLLFWTLVAFGIVYTLSALNARINIGHRHLLPLYPLVFILAGGAVALIPRRWGLILPATMAAWLAVENAAIYPEYLCYFNQLAGGSRRGHHYLADSNLDWGQDLKRLARWVRQHPEAAPIKLAYCGSANPAHYGFACEMLPSTFPFAAPAALTPGTYVISLNQLLGIYTPEIRDAFWADPALQEASPATQESALAQLLNLPQLEGLKDPTPWPLFLQQCRLINRLRHRPPDERIGHSLFVYHLKSEDLAAED